MMIAQPGRAKISATMCPLQRRAMTATIRYRHLFEPKV
jgi:hypothetical protein